MRRTRTPAAAVAAGLSLLLTGCGGSDDPAEQAGGVPSPSASASTAPTAVPAAPKPGLSTIVLGSTDPDGAPARFGAAQAALSGDGNVLAYRTPADDVTPAPPAGTAKSIAVRDLRTGTVTAACTSAKGEAANADCAAPSLSADGRYVVFESTATNLVGEDKTPNLDVFRKDLQTGKVDLVATKARTTTSVSGSPSISADGTRVAFVSDGQVHLADLGGDTVTLVSRAADGTAGDAASDAPRISPDGSTVAFTSVAGNLAGKPRREFGQVLIAKVATGKVVALEKVLRLRLPGDNYTVDHSAPSADGSRLAFAIRTADGSAADALTAKNVTGAGVYVADLNRATVLHTVRTPTRTTDRRAGCPALSADGKRLAYCTFRKARSKKASDGYVVRLDDVDGATTQLLSGAPKKTKSPDARAEAISADGSVVVYRSDDPQRGVTATITGSTPQMFVARPAD